MTNINKSEQNAIDALVMLSEYQQTPNNSSTPQSQISTISIQSSVDDIDDYYDNNTYETSKSYLLTNYYDERVNDTLLGWSYTMHPNSICLTPPDAWMNYEIPTSINVSWYKRPIYYCQVHNGFFISNKQQFVDKVNELGAVFDPR